MPLHIEYRPLMSAFDGAMSINAKDLSCKPFKETGDFPACDNFYGARQLSPHHQPVLPRAAPAIDLDAESEEGTERRDLVAALPQPSHSCMLLHYCTYIHSTYTHMPGCVVLHCRIVCLLNACPAFQAPRARSCCLPGSAAGVTWRTSSSRAEWHPLFS